MSQKALTWSLLPWIVIPLLVFSAAEVVYRQQLESSLGWYRDNVPSDGSQQILFLGTSRTRSAIDVAVFRKRLPADRQNVRVVNLGMGNSTQAIHLHALRDRVWANPDALKETTLFVETALGLPSFYFPDEFFWDQARNETTPWRWHLYLDTGTVLDPRFFANANLNLEGRLKLAVRTATRDSFLFGKREIIGIRWRDLATKAMKRIIGYSEPQTSQPSAIDLRGGGGVRTDAEGVAAMGDFELRMAESLEAFDAVFPSPEDTPAGALIDFALLHGAQVVCFETPTHSSKRRGFKKPNVQRFAEAFKSFFEDRGVENLQADFTYTDEDFPDRSHLVGSRSGEYTSNLYDAWRGL